MMFASPTRWLKPSIRITALLILTVVCGLLGFGLSLSVRHSLMPPTCRVSCAIRREL
jgi:hypothetical protein